MAAKRRLARQKEDRVTIIRKWVWKKTAILP